MIFRELEIPGAFIVEPVAMEDDRGFFARVFDNDEFALHGLGTTFEQWSISVNARAGTLRGMHFQTDPHAEAKLVRCTRGALYDVLVDLRPGSPTFKRWVAGELTADNRLWLYIPEGLAHGYQTLQDDTEVFYAISETHAPEAASGVRWDDPAFAIDWPPADELVMSDKDRSWPDFRP